MKLKAKLIAAILSVVLVLAAFPIGAGAAHYYACNRAQFIMDVTVRDGSRFAPGDTFAKTWRLRNTGSCTWDTNYALVFDGGEDFGVASPQKLTAPVPPWSYVDLTVPMTAPATPGKHRSSWKLEDNSSNRFGVGWGGDVAIFAEINVVPPPAVTYDFTEKAGDTAVKWLSGAGEVIFNSGTTGAPGGAVLKQATPKFESGVTASTPGLLVSPNNVNNGYIQGTYPEYSVKKGDRFQTTVGCAYEAYNCYVAFSLKYQIGSGPIYTLWTFRERYEGLTYSANINLNRLAGHNVKFVLYMSAYGSPAGDSAIWGHPVIVGTGTVVTPTGWSSNDMGDFTFDFPSNSVVSNVDEISLPIVPGTNLNRKSVEVSTKQLAAAGDACLSSNPGPSAATPVTFNGVEFMKETGSDGGAGNFQDWVSYSAKSPNEPLTCVSMTFVLSYSNAGNFDPPRPEYDKVAESAVFDLIMERFKWVNP